MEGTVKFFNQKKGFGFINGDDGSDYFVHFTALPSGLFLRENDRVAFDGQQGDRGLKAENVRLLQKGSERTDTAGSYAQQPAQEEGEEAEA
ncbi:MAG: cold shock domain-containing protein [Nanoarchaeota archaeon]